MKQLKHKESLYRRMLVIAAISGLCAAAAAGTLLLERQIALGALEMPQRLTAGEPAHRDIYAKRDIYYIDIGKTQKLRSQAAAAVQPIFHYSQDAAFQVMSRHERLSMTLIGGADEKTLTDEFSQLLSRTQIWRLTVLDEQELELVMQLSDEYLRYFLRTGVLSADLVLLLGRPESIHVRGLERSEPSKLIEERTSAFISEYDFAPLLGSLIANSGIPGDLVPAIFDVVQSLIEPNILYDDVATRLKMREAELAVRPASQKIEQGEIIVKKGFLVTSEAMDQLHSIQRQLYSKPPLALISQSMFTIMIFSFFFLGIYLLLPNTYRKIQYMHIVILFVLVFTLYLTVGTYSFYSNSLDVNIFFYPIALFSMLAITLLGNLQVAVLITLFLSSLYGTIPGSTFFDVVFLAIIGILGILFVRHPNRRIDMILGTGKLMLTYICIALVYIFHQSIPFNEALGILTSAAVNAAATGIMVIIMIPIFEHIFNLATVFRLRELAETSNPVLKRMINAARGTYSHSVSVAELVDSASEAVGANKLLAKVGALYHDIGKIDQPEYFIENQSGTNKHDLLKPSLSVAVIKSHVKIGIEKAKQMHLPREVRDIIGQHHGSDVINYFYMEAIRASEEGDKINEKDFSYHGTPPATKEAALVMIADSVDAAVRTLKQPTSSRIEKLIWTIITQKIESRQLSGCDLTMKDLEQVKNSFLIILTGRFHTRITYPSTSKGRKHHG